MQDPSPAPRPGGRCFAPAEAEDLRDAVGSGPCISQSGCQDLPLCLHHGLTVALLRDQNQTSGIVSAGMSSKVAQKACVLAGSSLVSQETLAQACPKPLRICQGLPAGHKEAGRQPGQPHLNLTDGGWIGCALFWQVARTDFDAGSPLAQRIQLAFDRLGIG